MVRSVHPRKTALVVVSLLFAAGFSLAAHDPVEGVIEGRLLMDGKPLVGAQITGCADRRHFMARRPCIGPIETRTDSDGRFTFKQLTGVTPPTPQEVKSHPMYAIADPGWSYGFRVDYEGMAAVFFDWGLGYGRTKVQLQCDFGEFLKQMKKQGIRPLANPENMPFMECDRQEQRVERQREEP
jgi:hypothetical protein